MTMLPVELNWTIGTDTGWKLNGLHLALGLKQAGVTVYLPQSGDPAGIPATLIPTLTPMMQLGDLSERRVMISAGGNHHPAPPEGLNRVHVCYAVFEDSHIDAEAIERLKRYDALLVPSAWCQRQLAAVGLASRVVHQGYDASLFHPAPRRRGNDGKFYIFSGGKLEFRKGQDIVVEAFKRFRKTDEGKNAVLVTAWHNAWPKTMESIWESGYVRGIPTTRRGEQDITGWLVENGIPAEASIDLGKLSQAEIANAIRECDCGLFPNRAEGATNMALTEAMACGLPCLLSQNTGHLEYQSRHPAWLSLWAQRPVTLSCPLYTGMDGWGESDPDEIVAQLEDIATAGAGIQPLDAAEWTWPVRAAEFARVLDEIATSAAPGASPRPLPDLDSSRSDTTDSPSLAGASASPG